MGFLRQISPVRDQGWNRRTNEEVKESKTLKAWRAVEEQYSESTRHSSYELTDTSEGRAGPR